MSLKLKVYRENRGLTQTQVVDEIYRRAVARGDKPPGLCPVAVSRHENGHKRPSLYYQAWYCDIYRATPEQLGFRVALPGENGHHEDVDRREFLTGTAGFLVTAALPSGPTRRLGNADVVELRESVIHLYKLGDEHGAGSVYPLTVRTLQKLRRLIEHASYDQATGQALQELGGQIAQHAGRLSFDANQDDNAHHWWLEAMKWSRLTEADSVSPLAMASIALQASDQNRPRETIDLAQAAQRIAGPSATPRLKSLLLAREALGHAGTGDAAGAVVALRRARHLAERPRHDDDPIWLAFYGPADFASHERRVALALNDLATAEDRARTALALTDPIGYPRNHAQYLVRLADDLVQRRQIDEAVAIAKQASHAVAAIESPRVTHALHAVTQRLAPFKGESL